MYAYEDLRDFPILDVFSQRKEDGKLYIINKGCKTLIGVIAPKDGKFIIEGYIDEFDSEMDAKELLMGGL